MHVAVAGAHGQIAMRLHPLLTARGDRVRGLIRNPDHAAELRELGVDPVECDLEAVDDAAPALAGIDAVVFAAGAGPGSGAERKRTMDLGGALKLIDAAKEVGARRFVMVSAMGAAEPPQRGGEVFGEYLRAKAEADEALRATDLDFTIVRPGRLTDAPGTRRISVGASLERGEIPRADVAATLAAALVEPATIGKAFDLVSGSNPIDEALAAIEAQAD